MRKLIARIREKGWKGIWYLALLIILPAFVGIPVVLWLVSQEKVGF